MLARGGWQRAFALRQHQLRRHVVSSRSRSLLALGLRSSATQLPLLAPPLGSVGLATHAGGRRPPPPSFAIAEAFTSDADDDNSDVYEDSGGEDDEESDGEDDRRRPVMRRSHHSSSVSRYSRSSDTDVNRPSAAFLEALENKKRWLNTLAAQRDFASLVQSVVDCYKPLYAQRPSLADAVTPQLPPLIDAHVTTAKFQPQRFSDAVTKATEQEVLSLLVVARQGPLAAAVFEHRRALAQHLQTSPMVLSSVASDDPDNQDEDDDRDTAEVLDLSHHFRSFYSFGMGAYSLLNAHATNLALYDEVVAAEAVYPTANMNASYLKALLTTRQPPADVRAFYADVATHSRPTNVFFYRQMLFFASAQHDGSFALQLLDDMKMKGYKLRSEDYLVAIRTYDDRYYFTPRTTPPTTTTSRTTSSTNRKHGDKPTTATRTTPLDTHTTPLDTYTSCVARFREQEDAPEQFQDLDGAAHTVVALFDEMVDDERLVPHSDHFFPRVIAAAVYAREFRKAVAYVALFDELFGGNTSGETTDDSAPSTLHNAGVRMAVNAFLLLDEPDEAWAFVRRVCGPRFEPRDFAHVANVVEYLCVHKDGVRLVRLLQDLQALGLLPLVSNSTVKTLLPTLVHPASGLSDDALYDAVVARFAAVFHVRTKPHAYSQFLNECVYRKRLVLAKRVLQERDDRRVGAIKVRLALRVVRACAEETADVKDKDNKDILALVPDVFKATDLIAATPAEVAELCYAVIRANRRLGRSDEGSKRLFARHVQPLVARGALSDVPEDIQSFAK